MDTGQTLILRQAGVKIASMLLVSVAFCGRRNLLGYVAGHLGRLGIISVVFGGRRHTYLCFSLAPTERPIFAWGPRRLHRAATLFRLTAVAGRT